MKYKIVDSLSEIKHLHISDSYYVKNEEVRVARYVNHIIFEELKNAFKTGKDCITFSINTDDENELNNHFVNDLEKLYSDLVDGYKAWGGDFDFANNVKVYIRKSKGVNTFSPLHLDNLKPLDKMPKKWNLTHVKKLLAHGAKAKCRGRYTDDYAFDAAINYGEGDVDNLYLLERITQSPSGWWVYKPNDEKNVLSVNCHHFDNNDVYIPDEMVE